METLFVRQNKRYRVAESDEVLTTASKILGSKLPGTQLNSPRDVEDFLKFKLSSLGHEVFGCVFLDNRHRVIAVEELFRGTIAGTAVYPREVVKSALLHNAAAVILYHNHPSGVPEPSRADEILTARLKEALALVETRVLDHLVVGPQSVVSFKERGLL